jgi:chitinase
VRGACVAHRCEALTCARSDIDYEYPATADQGKGFAALTTSLRQAFDALKAKKRDATPYQISVRATLGRSTRAC